jgi:pentapeptide repeat protein
MNPTVESAWIAASAALVGVAGTATVAIVGYFIARSTNRETLREARNTNDKTIASAHEDVRQSLEATRSGQVADLYSRAIDQLGSGQLHVRIGGIYALERVARDYEKDHPIVMEVLTAFIREYSRERWPPLDRREKRRWTRPDVQAAVTVVGHRDVERDTERIDLYGAVLISADLNDVDLGKATLRGANLTEAHLAEACLIGADLRDVTLDRAVVRNTDFTGARWSEDKPVPEGWKLSASSDPQGRRLERRDAGASASGPAAV